MRYSDDIIEEVRMKNDIVDVISQYVRLTRRGSSYFGLCPFHNEKTPSFSVTPSKQMYYCFGCGAGGNVYNFVMQYENYSFGEALSHLAERAGVELPKIEYSKEARAKARSVQPCLRSIRKRLSIFITSCAVKVEKMPTIILQAEASAKRRSGNSVWGIQTSTVMTCINI